MISPGNKIKTCNNDCIFCFIKQLPANLRPTLYLRDDDYLESYTNGNFITLSNLGKKDIDAIIKYEIEPLHISLHSYDLNIRDILFGNKDNQRALTYLEELDKNGIHTNIQIVLCPGINDGIDLENTLNILVNDYKNILSAGIVPVGITDFSVNKALKSFDKKSSRQLIRFIEDFRNSSNKKNLSKIFLSDEFYLIAGMELPSSKHYGKFLQIKNGIGKSADFLNSISNILKNPGFEEINKRMNSKILIITSEYGEKIINKAVGIIRDRYGLYPSSINVLAVRNKFFGGNIKVTGLLTGSDITFALKSQGIGKFEKILIPSCIFNDDGLTLDGYNINDICKLSKKIEIINEEAESLMKGLFE